MARGVSQNVVGKCLLQFTAQDVTREMENRDKATDNCTDPGLSSSAIGSDRSYIPGGLGLLSVVKCTHFNFKLKNKVPCSLPINPPPKKK